MRQMGRICALFGLLVLAVMGTGPASAANGDNLRTIIAQRDVGACASVNAAGNHNGVGTGIGFDGSQLYLSCWYDQHIVGVSPSDGSKLSDHVVIGQSGYGAMAWDNGRQVLWACSAQDFDTVGQINLVTNVWTPAFVTQGCIDGLAYDASDDTVWSSDDVSSHVEHWTSTGVLLSSNPISGLIGNCGNSGIAVGGQKLYLANNGCSQIYEVAKDFSSSTLFASFPARIEDLECDNITFAPGAAAIWSQDAYDNVLNAWEIPTGACLFGGGGPGPPANLTLTPSPATNTVDSQHCVTATVTDASGDPTPGITVRFTVTGSVNTSGTGSSPTDANGQATFCYTGPALPGSDVITAYADTNNNGVQDGGEPSGTATKDWVLPQSTAGCKITDGGKIVAANGDKATFGSVATGAPSGAQEYQDHGAAADINVHSTAVLAVVCRGNRASIFGKATINGSGSYNYRIDLIDNGEPGAGSDRYRIRLSTGYDSGSQILTGGNIQMH